MKIFFRKNWVLISILLFAFLIRVVGIFYGFPLGGVFSDEVPTVLAVLKMIGQQSWRPDFAGYYYPALLSYIYLPFFVLFLAIGLFMGLFPSIESLKELVILTPGYFLPLARFINIILAVGTIFLVYKIAFKLFNNKTTGLIAGWLLSVSFFYSHQSHFATTWIGQTFFVVLAAYWAVLMWNKRELAIKDYLIGGLLVGVAFGINFVGVLSYLFFLVVHFYKNKEKTFFKKFIINNKFWVLNSTILLLVIVVYILNPHGLNNYINRLTIVEGPSSHYQIFGRDIHHGNASFFDRFNYYLSSLWYLDTVYAILFLPALTLLFIKKRHIFVFLFFFIFLYLFFLSPLTGLMQRYLLPALPFVIVVLAYFAYWLVSGFKRNYIKIFLIILITAPSLYFSLLFDTKIIQGDTRTEARLWIYNNIDSGSAINNISWPKLYLNESKEIVSLFEEKKPALFSTKRNYLKNLSKENYPEPNYFIVTNKDILEDLNVEFNYFILADYNYLQLEERRKILPKGAGIIKRFYPVSGDDKKNINGELDGIFLDYPCQLKKIEKGGPYIEIYKVDKI